LQSCFNSSAAVAYDEIRDIALETFLGAGTNERRGAENALLENSGVEFAELTELR